MLRFTPSNRLSFSICWCEPRLHLQCVLSCLTARITWLSSPESVHLCRKEAVTSIQERLRKGAGKDENHHTAPVSLPFCCMYRTSAPVYVLLFHFMITTVSCLLVLSQSGELCRYAPAVGSSVSLSACVHVMLTCVADDVITSGQL